MNNVVRFRGAGGGDRFNIPQPVISVLTTFNPNVGYEAILYVKLSYDPVCWLVSLSKFSKGAGSLLPCSYRSTCLYHKSMPGVPQPPKSQQAAAPWNHNPAHPADYKTWG